jgi:hypothetical protein
VIKLILGRIGVALAAAAILATSAAIFVVALAFALYALVKPTVGPAGAAAIVAGGAALLVLLVGVALALAPKPRPVRISSRGKDPLDRAVNFFKDVPVTAIAAAIATGFFAIRNPRYLGVAVRSFLEGSDPETKRRR